MKQIMPLLCCLFTSQVLSANVTSDPSTLKLDWFWQNEHGQSQEIKANFSRNQVKQGIEDQQKLNYSLNKPVRALHTYIEPRLSHVVNSINYYSPENAVKFSSIEHAFSIKDSTVESRLFWQAYYQYQDDAFAFLRVSPCMVQDQDKPCIRPNYSQLFYDYRQSFKLLAEQLRSTEGAHRSISNAQSWVFAIPQAEEEAASFSPPLSVLLENTADSDEIALLLATIISQLEPSYQMYLVYPADSNGSVSPAWLTIESKSGAKGSPVVINNTQHTLLTGSSNLLKEMMIANTQMVSEPLY